MADTSKNNTSSDEIDLGQLFQMIRRGFNLMFKGILRFFIFLKKNYILIIGLAILGVLVGFGLTQIVSQKMKIEVIVRPNLESKDYLYDVVQEINSNIESRNKPFFDKLEIPLPDVSNMKVEIQPIVDKEAKSLYERMEYLELLQKIENTSLVSDVLRIEILKNSTLNHKITFEYRKKANGDKATRKLLDYINSNEYFKELVRIDNANSRERIKRNEELINQIDRLIEKLSSVADNNASEGRIVFDQEDEMGAKGLLELKNSLLRDIENKRIELLEQNSPISIINLGTPHEIVKPFFGKTLVLLPLLFIGGFFLVSILMYLNKKAGELN